ncbi:MAG: D-alanine--D-alanine ligase [Treponema sp.]|nr:D-alanine--D-alanine ligase [Treponema sp.]MBD5442079.1 D-alanine--D-alanine ligase [Treponema sp.]
MNVAVMYGGRSGEHEISLVSAAAIARGLGKNHTVTLIGIASDGKWYLQPESEYTRICTQSNSPLKIDENPENELFIVPAGKNKCFKTAKKSLAIDIVFPVLHGSYGEDGTIQGLFEMADIAYVGCGTLASALAMDKEKAKQIVEASGIKIVPYICIKRCDLNDSNRYDELFKKAVDTLGFPMFVKPCCAGSTNGVNRVENAKGLSYALMEAFSWDDKVLIETAVDAREIECSVTGNAVSASMENEAEIVTAYIPGEINPTHTFYDFDAKYTDPDGAHITIPADLSVDMEETVRVAAARIYKLLDCSGLSRVDFFIDRQTDELYFNEINTMPGFTPISMFPKMCAEAGLDFESLLERLLAQGLARYNSKNALQTSR